MEDGNDCKDTKIDSQMHEVNFAFFLSKPNLFVKIHNHSHVAHGDIHTYTQNRLLGCKFKQNIEGLFNAQCILWFLLQN